MLPYDIKNKPHIEEEILYSSLNQNGKNQPKTKYYQ